MNMQILAIAIAILTVSTLTASHAKAQESSPAPTAATTSTSTAQKAETDWEGVSVELSGVTRGAGETITIKWRYVNSGSKPADIAKASGAQHDNLAERAYYVDPGNKKKYLVVKDAQGKAVASNMQYLKLDAGASRAGWAKFPAPPAGVSKIDVYIPGAPPFEGVSIASQ